MLQYVGWMETLKVTWILYSYQFSYVSGNWLIGGTFFFVFFFTWYQVGTNGKAKMREALWPAGLWLCNENKPHGAAADESI